MKQVKGPWGYVARVSIPDEYAISYPRVIRTEFIALWLCSGKSHESGCEHGVLQTYGAYRPQELGVTILTQSHLFPTVITPPLQGDYS